MSTATGNLNDPHNIMGMGPIYGMTSGLANLDQLEQSVMNKTTIPSSTPEKVDVDYDKILQEPMFDESYSFSKSSFSLPPISESAPSAPPKPFIPPSNAIQRDPILSSYTEEEKREREINNVLRDLNVHPDDTKFIADREEEDEKIKLLERIDSLKTIIESEGTEVKNIPPVNSSTPLKDLRLYAQMLQVKYDGIRYSDAFQELILAGAYGLEVIFNGKREFFGARVDLTDYSSVVKTKLRRLHYDTGTFVQSVMKNHNVSPGVRILLELLPTLFLHAHKRGQQKNDNIVNETQVNEKEYENAINNLNT